LDRFCAAACRMYQRRSSAVSFASMMTTFCVQFKRSASPSSSGMPLYNCQKSRIRRTLRGEKPVISGYCSFMNSAAATAAPFSEWAQTALPISQYSSICGRSAFMTDSSVANIVL